jgi:ribonuclease HI
VNCYILFGDGACSGNPGPGGWGVILLNPFERLVTESGGASLSTTNNIMELTALLEGLKLVLRSAQRPAQVKVYFDSQYVLKGSSEWIKGWKNRGWKKSDGTEVANLNLWQSIDEILEELKKQKVVIQWHYVEAHAGIPANERVDEIAVGFSKNSPPELYKGEMSSYSVSLDVSGPRGEPVYLSLVNGVLKEHLSWEECQKEVSGKKGAKFKKIKNNLERSAILSSWGVNPK